jgi:mRNA interferase MazF
MIQEYIKDFKGWCGKKEIIDKQNLAPNFFFLKGEVWWVSLGVNVGQEVDGKNESYERPVLIFKKFSDELAWVIPSSSTKKANEYFYPIIYQGKPKNLLLLHMKTISSKRLLRPVFRMKGKEFTLIKERVHDLISSIKEIPSD